MQIFLRFVPARNNCPSHPSPRNAPSITRGADVSLVFAAGKRHLRVISNFQGCFSFRRQKHPEAIVHPAPSQLDRGARAVPGAFIVEAFRNHLPNRDRIDPTHYKRTISYSQHRYYFLGRKKKKRFTCMSTKREAKFTLSPPVATFTAPAVALIEGAEPRTHKRTRL